MIPTYSDTVNLNYDKDTLLRYKEFIDYIKQQKGIQLKATSANDGTHAPNSWHGVDAVDFSWDDLNGWDDPRLAEIADVARQMGWGEVISDPHGTGPHLHMGNINGGGKVIPNQQQLPIQFTGADGNSILKAMGTMRTPDYNEQLNMAALQESASTPMQNSKRATQQAFLNNLPLMQAMYASGNRSDAIAKTMPIVQQMTANDMAASEQDANIANEMAKRQAMSKLLQTYSQSRNPQNMAAYASAIEGIGGPKVNDNYAQMSFLTPGNMLQAAMTGAAEQAANQRAMASLAQQKEHQDAMLELNKQKITGGGAGGIPIQRDVNLSMKIDENFNKVANDALTNWNGSQDGHAKMQSGIQQLTALLNWAMESGDTYTAGRIFNQIEYMKNQLNPKYQPLENPFWKTKQGE